MRLAALSLALALAACATAPAIPIQQPGETDVDYLARRVHTEVAFVCGGDAVCVEEQLAARERYRAIRVAHEPAPSRTAQVVGGPTIILARGMGSADKLAVQRALTDALAETLAAVGSQRFPDWIAAEVRLHEILAARGVALD